MDDAAWHIAQAGWAINAQVASSFPTEGSHLARYAQRVSGVEINSCFYRPHKPATYARWAASVPAAFRFAVKLAKSVTHEPGLSKDALASGVAGFLAGVLELGDKLGPILVQLPPSRAFEPRDAARLLGALRREYAGFVVCEPRHPTWFGPDAEALLRDLDVARVAADPFCVPAAAEPGGAPDVVYFRLHGSPEIYRSAYTRAYLDALAETFANCVRAGGAEGATRSVWCVFDNTASGAALGQALAFERLVARELGLAEAGAHGGDLRDAAAVPMMRPRGDGRSVTLA